MVKKCNKCGLKTYAMGGTIKFCVHCGNELITIEEKLQEENKLLQIKIKELEMELKNRPISFKNTLHENPIYKEYMSNIATTAQKLIKSEGITKSEAFKKAYMLRKKPVIPKDVNKLNELMGIIDSEQFPNISHIDTNNGMKKLLEEMVKNVINSPFTANLSYNMEGKILGLNDLQTWHEFAADFMCKSEKISKYFKVHNSFKMNGKSNISYG